MTNNELIDTGREVIREEIKALGHMAGLLNSDFAEAARLVSDSNKLIVTGIGKSGLVGKKIAATFSSFGISAVYLHPVEALHGDIGLVQKNDAALLLSKSGSTDELVKFIPYLKMRQAKIISIVGNINSFLSRAADITLNAYVEKEACPFNLAPTTSSTAALAMGDALAIAVMKLKGITLEDFARLHPLGQIGRNITIQVRDIMHTNSNMPKVDIDCSFREALIEITNKGLGCACILDGDKLKGIITDGDVRRLLQIREDLTDLKVSEIMTKDPITVSEFAYLGEALALMENRKSQINVLPVVNNLGRCTGLIRLHDIIRSGL
ncbi:MAG: SIS domain-containing protein [Candidatus Kapaibacterium sp.]